MSDTHRKVDEWLRGHHGIIGTDGMATTGLSQRTA
jgi:hypothetical protein